MSLLTSASKRRPGTRTEQRKKRRDRKAQGVHVRRSEVTTAGSRATTTPFLSSISRNFAILVTIPTRWTESIFYLCQQICPQSRGARLIFLFFINF